MDEAEEGGGRESKKNEKKKQRKCDKDGETETGEEETEGMKELEMVDSPRCVCVCVCGGYTLLKDLYRLLPLAMQVNSSSNETKVGACMNK